MKKQYLIAALVLLATTALAYGQPLRGSYFFETSVVRGKMNPAFAPQNNYVAIPLVGGISLDDASNVGLKNFIYPSGNKAYTFLNEAVSSQDFLSALPVDDPFLTERLDIDVLSAGFGIGKNGFLSVGLSIVEDAGLTLPTELLRFAKVGGSADITGLGLNVGSYGQLSVGYSHDLGDVAEGLHVGGRVKLLAGVIGADMTLDRINIKTGTDQLSVSTSGTGYLAALKYDEKDGFGMGNAGINGMGVAVDLGVEYRIKLDGFVNGVNLSASVCDLGALNFNKNVTTLTASGSASFAGLNGIDSDYDFSTNLDNVISDFENLANFKSQSGGNFSYKVTPTVLAGVEAPFLGEKMSLGLLYWNTRGRSNVMASYNLSPVRWFNLGLNCTFVGPALSYGFYAEFIPKKSVGLFFGMDTASLKTNSKGIAVNNLTQSACFGLNIVFGGK